MTVLTSFAALAGCDDRKPRPEATTRVYREPEFVQMTGSGEPRDIDVDGESWKRFPVLADADFEVALLVRPIASASDTRFLGFEFVNRTGHPIEIGSASHYRIEATRSAKVNDRFPLTGSLGSGNDYDLIHRDVIDIDGPRLPLPPGVSRRLDVSSGNALSLLGVAEATESIAAVVHLTLSRGPSGSQRIAATPADGVPIAFDWVPPDAKGRLAMQERLRRIIRSPDRGARNGAALSALLADAETADAVTVDDALAGLGVRGQSAREPVARLVSERFADNPQVIDAYVKELNGEGRWWVWDLAAPASRLTDRRFVAPLMMRISAASPMDFEVALRAMSRHIPLADDPAATSTLLGRLTLARCPLVASGGWSVGHDLWRWHREATLLALTRDESLVPRFVASLDDHTVFVNARTSVMPLGVISDRVCDIAHDAIADLIDLPGERCCEHRGDAAIRPPKRPADRVGNWRPAKRRGPMNLLVGAIDPVAEVARRDAAIDRLRARLKRS